MSLLPNLDQMTDNEKLAVLESIQKSIAQSKELQKKKIGENVDLVVQALKKIESDIRDRFDSVGNSIEKRVLSIKDGRDGINGKDGRDGKDGRSGKDGLKGDKGNAGQDGTNGIDGADGVSVVNANIDFDGSLIITLSSGQEINVGEVVSQDVVEKLKIITSGGAGSGGGGSGTVTSVAVSGGTTGLTTSGGPITTSGTVTLGGTLAVASGGTGTATPSIVAGTNITVSGTWPNQTVAASGGTVTSVAATVPAFLSVSGSPVTTTGTLAIGLSGTALPVANGGTNATTAGLALTNLSAAGTAIANTFTDSQVVQAASAATEVVRVRGIDTNTSALAVQRYSADSSPAEINLYKSRGTTVGSDARVQTNDVTGSINYYACGSSAGSYQIIAAIRAQDGTTTADNDLPGSLRFFTRTDSTSGTLTQKMVLGSGGTLSVTSDISTSGGSITAAGYVSASYAQLIPPSASFINVAQVIQYAAPTTGFTAGDIIYTQDAYYAATNLASPGYIPTYQSVYLAADFTLQAASGVQACLTAANDTLTIAAATTYEFEGQYILNTGATTHTTAMAFLLASSATVSSFEYTTILWSAAANTISTSASFTQVSGVASKVLNATSTAVYTTIKFKGVMRTTLGGTITPQIAFSANPTGTNLMKKGSFVKFTPIGADTVEPIGLWG